MIIKGNVSSGGAPRNAGLDADDAFLHVVINTTGVDASVKSLAPFPPDLKDILITSDLAQFDGYAILSLAQDCKALEPDYINLRPGFEISFYLG